MHVESGFYANCDPEMQSVGWTQESALRSLINLMEHQDYKVMFHWTSCLRKKAISKIITRKTGCIIDQYCNIFF